MATVGPTPHRIETTAGPLIVRVGSALSAYDVEASDGVRRAELKDPKPYRRLAWATTPTRYDSTRAVAEPLTINGVEYDATVYALDLGNGWEAPVRQYDYTPRLHRQPWGDPTDAARRFIVDRILPEVVEWLNAHPTECAAMEADALSEAIVALHDRLERIEAGAQMIRDYRERMIEARGSAMETANR